MILAVIHDLGARGEGKLMAVPRLLPHTYNRESNDSENPKSYNRDEIIEQKNRNPWLRREIQQPYDTTGSHDLYSIYL